MDFDLPMLDLWNVLSFLFGGIGTLLIRWVWLKVVYSIRPKIEQPADDQIVQHETVVRGRFNKFAKNQQIWIFVSPVKIGRYYPQRTPALKDTSGNWTAAAHFGASPEHEKGDEFNIYTVTADFEGTNSILRYLMECLPEENWPGLAELPRGCKARHHVRVFRDTN